MSRKLSQTRERILATALELLVKNRGKNVRMADIAAASGVSRQAVYLHFRNRTELMVATVQYGDELRQVSSQIRPWQEAEGVAKLDAWFEFWGHYVPQIFGVARALMVARETDPAAAAAWNDRMADLRDCCRQSIESLSEHGELAPGWEIDTATDALWTMCSIPAWEQLTAQCGWSTGDYVRRMQRTARAAFVDGS